jgi:hypothetical protein
MPTKSYNFKNYLWTIPFLSFLLGYFTIQKIFQPKSFNTPSIVGKRLQEAISILSKNQLNIKFISEKEDEGLPHGTILSQKPVPGLKITPNQSVYVTISKKPDRSACPELFKKNIKDILQILKDKNLRNKSYYVPSNLPDNSCVAQYPLPETSIKDTCIITYVSKGNKKPVIFPNFKNKKLPEVLEFLRNYNIKTEIIYSDNAEGNKLELLKSEPVIQEQEKQEQVKPASEQDLTKQEPSPKIQESQNNQDGQNSQATQSQETQNTQGVQTQETKTIPENQNAQITQAQNGQDLQTTKTQQLQENQNLQQAPQVAQTNQEVQETQDLTILDQRPLAGSLVNLDPRRPITVHLKVFKK